MGAQGPKGRRSWGVTLPRVLPPRGVVEGGHVESVPARVEPCLPGGGAPIMAVDGAGGRRSVEIAPMATGSRTERGNADAERQRSAAAAAVVEFLGTRGGRTDAETLARYATDESNLGSFPPDAVALVEHTAEASEVLRRADLDRVPVTPRGAGTGMTGGALAVEGGVVLSTERMDRVLDIDEKNLLAVVQPGVITGHLQALVEERGLFYPPDPASLDSCSIGGNVAENAGGPRAFRYGVTREYVLGLELVLPGGQILRPGRRTVKGVTGLDLVALVVGSEGTLGVVTEVTLKLLPRPQAVATFFATFGDAITASKAVGAVLGRGDRPRCLEFLDASVLEHLRRAGSWPVPRDAGALLLVELDGEAEAIEAKLLASAEACEAAGAREVLVATDEGQRRRMWEMRRRVNPTLKEQHRFKVSEDVVVPGARIPEMVRRLDELAERERVTIASFGHAGDGNLHVNLLFDDEAFLGEALERTIRGVFEHALSLGGTLSGEHGIGIAKRRFVRLEQSEELVALQRAIRRCFDPHGVLNPGKLLPDP
jgi:glycolate oxidase